MTCWLMIFCALCEIMIVDFGLSGWAYSLIHRPSGIYEVWNGTVDVAMGDMTGIVYENRVRSSGLM